MSWERVDKLWRAAQPPKVRRSRHACAECAKAFKPAQVKQVFCSTGCKQAYHNRAAKRGKVLVPLVMAQRQGRNTATGRQAHGEWARLVSQFTAEDKAAGRMSAHDFIRRQHALFLRS